MKKLTNYYKKIIIESMEHGYRPEPSSPEPEEFEVVDIQPDQIRPIGYGSGNPQDRPPVRPGTGIRPTKWRPLTPFVDPNTVINNPMPYVPDNRRKR